MGVHSMPSDPLNVKWICSSPYTAHRCFNVEKRRYSDTSWEFREHLLSDVKWFGLVCSVCLFLKKAFDMDDTSRYIPDKIMDIPSIAWSALLFLRFIWRFFLRLVLSYIFGFSVDALFQGMLCTLPDIVCDFRTQKQMLQHKPDNNRNSDNNATCSSWGTLKLEL